MFWPKFSRWSVVPAVMMCSAMPAQQRTPPGFQHPSAPAQAPASQQTQPKESAPTIKVSVQRVALDITVTDAKGKPVADLKPGDFQVFEDRVPQRVRSFQLQQLQVGPPPVALPKLPANTFVNLPRGPEGGPPTVILWDLLNTPQDSQPYAREQLLSFLKKRTANTQMAIFVLRDRLYLLQGFTDDSDLLIAALDRKGVKSYRSTYLQGAGEATRTSDALTATEGNQNGASDEVDPAFQQIASMMQHMETMETSYLLDRRVDITADALQDLAHFLVGQPGRKNLLWLSGSFPAGILPTPDAGSRDTFQVTRNYSKVVMEATDMLTTSHVAVYPIDVRGLQVNPMFSAANKMSFEPGQGKDTKAVRSFADAQAAEHTTMDNIAESTGGHAFYNTNGLAAAEAAAVQEGSTYYAITYSPTNPVLDGKVRHVRVEVNRPGLRVAYRRSYFADDLDARAQDAADHSDDALAAALQHGAPIQHDLFFEAHVEADGTPVQATEEQVAELLHYEAFHAPSSKKTADPHKPVMLQRYVLQYVMVPRQLDIQVGADELRHDNLDVAAICYDVDGMALNGERTKLQDAIHNDRWAMMQHEGYHVPMTLLVPAQARSLRLAVEDNGNHHMGSIEITLPLAREGPDTGPQHAPAVH